MRSIIVAYDCNRAIGSHNQLPWLGEMRDDMQRFRHLTTGHTVIMGRKTYESIGRPLPDRRNIILSRNALKLSGCEVVGSLDDAYRLSSNDQEVYVIGGETVYKAALPSVDQILATEITTEIADADAFFPEISTAEWDVVKTESHPADSSNRYPYQYVTHRKTPNSQ